MAAKKVQAEKECRLQTTQDIEKSNATTQCVEIQGGNKHFLPPHVRGGRRRRRGALYHMHMHLPVVKHGPPSTFQPAVHKNCYRS